MTWMSVTEAARSAGVSPDTIRRWCDANRLPSMRTAGGHRRIASEALALMLTDGPKSTPLLDRHTRDIAAVFESWRDQVEELRPFQRRAFDDKTSLSTSLAALEGPIGRGGLIGELSDLAREIRDELDAASRLSA